MQPLKYLGYFDVVKVLLNHYDIKVDAENKKGKTALDLAEMKGSEISEIFKEKVGNQYDQIIQELKEKSITPEDSGANRNYRAISTSFLLAIIIISTSL